MHRLRNIRALYSVFLSIKGETVTFQFNCTLQIIAAKIVTCLLLLGNGYLMKAKHTNMLTISLFIYLLEGAENSRNKVNILLYELTNANSTSKLSTF